MNILVLDIEEKSLNTIMTINSIFPDLDFKIVSNFNNIEEIYKSYKTDIVLIDFKHQVCDDAFAKIMKINPSQRTITYSDYIGFSESLGCEVCQSKNYRKRILKPIDISTLIHAIKNFDTIPCRFFKFLDHIEDHLGDIIRRFPSCTYDSVSKEIKLPHNDNHARIQCTIEIDKLLNRFQISHKMMDINTIILL